jgi:transcriptional regulator with XRE-family HTH domain
VARRESAAKIKLTIGRRVAELRRGRGWTQEKMAERIGTSVQWLSRIEGGGENVTIDTIVGLANALGVGVIELLEPPEQEDVRRRSRARGRPKKSAS